MDGQEEKGGQPEAIRRIENAIRSNATELDLKGLELTAVPDLIFQFASLTSLDLSDNQLGEIPESLAKLANLSHLDLGNNQLGAIPEFLAQLVNLSFLDLAHNQLRTVPEFLPRLSALRLLDLSGNGIGTIPEFVSELKNLTWLSFGGNEITAIPDSLAKLDNLECLYLDDNKITIIPDSLARIAKLRTLFLYSNQITVIPDSLTQLASLQDLRLFDNQIAVIPESLAQLTNLQLLHLSSNRITEVPRSLAQLSHLENLDIRHNPLPEETLAALAGGVQSFFRFLQSTSQRKVHPRTVKLVLLGEPKAGKTTLLEALKGNPHPCDDSRDETIGVDVVSIERPHPADHKPMYLSVWDFAGQHMEHATHQFFLTENAIYLILWSARQGAESSKRDLWYWLELLKMRVRNPKFLLVATHTAKTPADLNLSEIERTYGGYQGQFPIDLKDLTGMEPLEAKIIELAADSPSIRAEWPMEWLPVRDEIREIRKKRPHMPPAEFRGLMAGKGVTDGVSQNDLAGQLHHLGEILYFQERDELSSLVILSPEWVTELIGLVVRSKRVRENNGILRKDDLADLWKQAELQPEIQDHLVHLMDWFDLTYSTPYGADVGIVVEALPYSTPDDLKQIELSTDQAHTEMIFRFPSLLRRLPPGIPTWGFARAHRFSQRKPWRDAAAFEDLDSKSQAVILASETRREIRLKVSADYPPFFFGVLESILRDTFKRYPGAEPERRLPCCCRPSCATTYLFETVLKRRKDGKQFVTCDISGEDVDIESLLSGASRPETREGLHALHSEMRRGFTESLVAQREQLEKTCPSVFTLAPSHGFKQLETWFESATRKEELELVIYCEHYSGWHTTSHSVYRFTPDQEWFESLKKQWTQLVRVTKYVGPLIKVIGKPTGPWGEIAAAGMDKLPEATLPGAIALSRELGEKGKPEFISVETRYLLEQLIDDLDSRRPLNEPKNGGLHRYIIEDGRLLWLCPEHINQYKSRQ
jgi:internalin A